MADGIINAEKRFDERWRSHLVELAANGLTGGNYRIAAKFVSELFETVEEEEARIAREDLELRSQVVSMLVPTKDGYRISLNEGMGYAVLLGCIIKLANEYNKPIDVSIPVVICSRIAPIGEWRTRIEVGEKRKSMEICNSFHLKEKKQYIEFLESPKGRRFMMVESTRPKPMSWDKILRYLKGATAG